MVSTIKKASMALMIAAFATIMLGGYAAANTHVVYACGHHCGGCGGCGGFDQCGSCGGFGGGFDQCGSCGGFGGGFDQCGSCGFGNSWNWNGGWGGFLGGGWGNCFC
jgi:hypothetical protein